MSYYSTKPVHTVCWWLVGPECVAFDLHDAGGELTQGTHGFNTGQTHAGPAREYAANVIAQIAKEEGAAVIAHDDHEEAQYSEYYRDDDYYSPAALASRKVAA
jgi:hypothetical protein